MFKKLSDFRFERTWKQSIGFYIAYMFLGIIFGGLAGGLYGLITGDNSFEGGVHTGQIVAILYCLGLAVIMTKSKGILPSFKAFMMIALSGLIAVFIGTLGGLIPIAYLSTTDPYNK